MIIKVKTSASKTISPDFMKILFKLTSLNLDKNEAINTVVNNFNTIKDYFSKNGISESLKTSSYSIKESFKRESYKEVEDGTTVSKYKEVFDGFLVTHVIEISIPIDVLFATKLITTFSKEKEIHVNINYFLKNSKNFQDEVIKDALNRAREKALVIACSFGKPEVKCNLVDYTYNSFNGYSKTALMLEESNCIGVNSIEEIAETLNPVDITITENVYTEWEI